MSSIYRTHSYMRYFTPNLVILDVTLKSPVTPVILLYNLYSLQPACKIWMDLFWWEALGSTTTTMINGKPSRLFLFLALLFFCFFSYDNFLTTMMTMSITRQHDNQAPTPSNSTCQSGDGSNSSSGRSRHDTSRSTGMLLI